MAIHRGDVLDYSPATDGFSGHYDDGQRVSGIVQDVQGGAYIVRAEGADQWDIVRWRKDRITGEKFLARISSLEDAQEARTLAILNRITSGRLERVRVFETVVLRRFSDSKGRVFEDKTNRELESRERWHVAGCSCTREQSSAVLRVDTRPAVVPLDVLRSLANGRTSDGKGAASDHTGHYFLYRCADCIVPKGMR